MKTKPFFISFALLKCLPTLVLCLSMTALVYGQDIAIEIQGTVKDNNGIPLSGASIVLLGSSNGAATNFEGQYVLRINRSISDDDFLEASSLGFKKERIRIGGEDTINFVLEPDNEINEVIVTAQGITREKRSIGYGISVLTAEEIKDRPYSDLAQALNGKISGLRVYSDSGRSGEETRIEIRSQLSLQDSRDPLIVKDDIPYSGSLSDINIDDVKSVTVLKGLSASTLYGNRGRNGVILVETFTASGTGILGVQFSGIQRFYTNRVGTLPEYQNKYGSGLNFEFDPTSPQHFGPAFEDLDEIPHPLSEYHGDAFPEFKGTTIPYEAKPDNVSKLFNPAFGSNTTIVASSYTEGAYYSGTLGYINEGGIFGRNHYETFNFNINGETRVNNKLTFRANASYADRRILDNLGNPVSDIINLPRQIDLTEFPFEDPVDGTSVYFRRGRALNPLWTVDNTRSNRQLRSFSLNAVFDYIINDFLSLQYRGNYFQSSAFNKDDANRSLKIGDTSAKLFSRGETSLTSSILLTFDQAVVFTLKKTYLTKKIAFDASFGANSVQSKFQSIRNSFTEQVIRDYFNPEAFLEEDRPRYNRSADNFAGAFLQAILSYENYLYLTLSGRNEWGSTTEKEHQSIFFPSASVSFIPSSLFNFDRDVVSYLQLRAGFASSTGFPPRYRTRPFLEIGATREDRDGNDIVTLGLNPRFANRDLKPELHQEVEVGLEGHFWNSRIDLDISAYRRVSTDLIQDINISPSTGYENATVNFAKVDGEGIEIDLGIDLVKSPDFSYKLTTVFDSHRNVLKGIHPLASSNQYEIGESLSIIKGNFPLRDEEGNLLIDLRTGSVVASSDGGRSSRLPNKIIGDRLVDWTMSNIHRFDYKQFSLETQIEYHHGGDQVTSFSYRGALRNTEDREGGYVINGVLADSFTKKPIFDADGNKIPNTIVLPPGSAEVAFASINELSLWDRSHFRIRDILLTYNFKKSQIEHLNLKSLRLTLTATNLWYRAINFPKYANYDPRNAGGTGVLNVPENKRVSLTLSTTF